MFVGLDVEIGYDRWLSGHGLNDLCVETEGFVGVGEVTCRRYEETEFSGRVRRPDDEHDIFLRNAGTGSDPQPHGVDAALETGRHRHAVGGFPATIGHRIGVELDAAELRRIEPEAIVLAVPIPAGHG